MGQYQRSRGQSGADCVTHYTDFDKGQYHGDFPNSTVASAEVVNLTSKSLIRFDIEVRIALEAEIEQARDAILRVLEYTKEIVHRPAPTATVDKIGDFGVHFIVRFWVNPPHVARMPVIKEIMREQIKQALDNEGILTPYPHMQLVLQKMTIAHAFSPLKLPNNIISC